LFHQNKRDICDIKLLYSLFILYTSDVRHNTAYS